MPLNFDMSETVIIWSTKSFFHFLWEIDNDIYGICCGDVRKVYGRIWSVQILARKTALRVFPWLLAASVKWLGLGHVGWVVLEAFEHFRSVVDAQAFIFANESIRRSIGEKLGWCHWIFDLSKKRKHWTKSFIVYQRSITICQKYVLVMPQAYFDEFKLYLTYPIAWGGRQIP